VTGIGALEHFQKQATSSANWPASFNVGEDGLRAQVEKLSQTAKQLEKEWRRRSRKVR